MTKVKQELRDIKRRAQRLHVLRRAHERLGYELSNDDIDAIRLKVERGRGDLLVQPSLRTSIWRIVVDHRKVVVVYDHETEEIATIMTTGMWQETDVAKSPAVTQDTPLKGSLENHPAGKALQDLKDKLNGP